ncbi:MAG TPA: L-2-hydroxyglutarate oxidase [Planctomycetota bacterium]
MSALPDCDVAIVGGGLVGLATARALVAEGILRVTVLEAETRVAAHQSGHNSGVVHSGLYYRPDSLRARLCREGAAELESFCAAERLPFERCGKLVLATGAEELPRLDALEARGRANGLQGLQRLGPAEIEAREPHARGLAALLVPETGITDFGAVGRALARTAVRSGVRLRMAESFRSAVREHDAVRIRTSAGTIRCRHLVACAGLQADRVARRSGLPPQVRIVPFRGEFRELVAARRGLVRHLIYPVPDLQLPFLGVHWTRRPDGRVEAGPNAVPAWSRHGYAKGDFSLRDAASMLTWPGFWRMSWRHRGAGAAELRRARSTRRLAAALARMVPALRPEDLEGGSSGVRALALDRSGALVDDFAFAEAPGMTHVLNAPSPAATACLALGREIAARVLANWRFPV